jgi:hypothetical protein
MYLSDLLKRNVTNELTNKVTQWFCVLEKLSLSYPRNSPPFKEPEDTSLCSTFGPYTKLNEPIPPYTKLKEHIPPYIKLNEPIPH